MAPLLDGCTGNNSEVVKILIDAGADVNIQADLNDWAPLHFAVTSGGKAVQTLLEVGADPTIPAESGDTAMHLAAANSMTEVDFQLFVDHGHDTELENDAGQTPLAVTFYN